MTPPLHRLILWDIDGTLVNSGAIAREVFDLAVDHAVGIRPVGAVAFSGKTDRQITEEFLELVGSEDPTHADAILDRIEVELAENAERIAADGSICPGAKAVVESLTSVVGVAQSVLTGNVAANARIKLGTFGLGDLLDLDAGAYGREHNDRTKLLAVAWSNQFELHGERYTPDETWIVGDTPNDLACARSGGAHCLLVGTGRFSVTELEGHGADAVLPDLLDTERVVALLTR